MSELKPCPFCGGDARLDEQEIGVHFVHCPACDVDGPWRGQGAKDAIIAAWNSRATDWQDISTAPRDGRCVLLSESGLSFIGWWVKLSNGNPGWEWRGDGRLNPTHWMPLPAPPKEVG
jgi:Lar family restriction alleviation protein